MTGLEKFIKELEELKEIFKKWGVLTPVGEGILKTMERCLILAKKIAEEESVKLDSIGCCPKCVTLIKDMSHEPLAILAERKDINGIRIAKNMDFWVISLRKIEGYGRRSVKQILASTYRELEAKAREYLNGLPAGRQNE